MDKIATLTVTSKAFSDNGFMPKKYTGFADDISPDFEIDGLPDNAKSLTIVMFDLDIPFIGKYPHWLIWNITPAAVIPENIPYGEYVPQLGNAVQGAAYGKNRYRGPKQPFFIFKMHRYEFNVFALDTMLELSPSAVTTTLFSAMDGHILAQGKITGKYKR